MPEPTGLAYLISDGTGVLQVFSRADFPEKKRRSMTPNDIAWTGTVLIFAGVFLWRYWEWLKR